jgi:WD40 repeat protein
MSSSGARVAFASAQQPILAWQAEPAQMTGSRFQLAIPEHIAISADGQRFAFARGQAVRIWDPASNRDVTQIPLLTPVTALAMSANGDRIATVGFTPEVQIFDVATRTSVAHLVHRNMESVGQVTFGPAGSAWLATVSMTRLDMFDHRYLVSLWDLSRQTPVRQAEFRAIVDEVLIDPGGRTLAVRIEDETVRLLAIGDDRKDLILTHEDAVLAMVFEPAGRYLATLTSQGTVRVWMTDSGREVSRIARAAATASASAITFSPDGRRLAVATGNRVYIQDAIAIEEQARLEVGATVRALDFSPRLEAVAIGTGDVGSEGALHLWRPVSGGHVQRKADYNHSVETVLIDPSDTRLLAGSSDPVSCASQAQLFSLDTTIDRLLSTPLDLAEPIPGCFSSAAFSPDGDYIVGAGYNDPVARIWRTSSGRPTASLVHADVVHAVAWSPAGSGLVATAAADGRVLIWRDGKEIRGFEQGEGVTALAFGADGRHLVSGGENGVAKVWDVDSGAVLGSIVHGARVLAVAYAPDARHVATAGRDHSVRLWNMDSRQTIAQLAHDGEVEVLAFSPDAAHLATAASGGKLRIWSVPDAGEVARSLQGDVSAARFSPDGAKLITGSHDGYVRMLLWRPQDLVAEVCSRVSGNLTPAVWQRLLGDEEYVATCTAGSE